MEVLVHHLTFFFLGCGSISPWVPVCMLPRHLPYSSALAILRTAAQGTPRMTDQVPRPGQAPECI